MTRIPVAVQLYSVREDAAKDLAGVLKAIAKMGYDGVEFAGFYGHDAKTVRAMLDEYGLKAEGAHVGINTLMGDELQMSIEFHATIGNSFLIVPGLDHSYTDSRAGWLKAAHILNDVSKNLPPRHENRLSQSFNRVPCTRWRIAVGYIFRQYRLRNYHAIRYRQCVGCRRRLSSIYSTLPRAGIERSP